MAALFFLIWGVALGGAGLLSAVVRSDNGRVVRAARVVFAFVFAIDVFVIANAFDLTNTNPKVAIPNFDYQTEGSFWWLIALGGGIPIALLFGVAVRRAYAGHRVALISAVLAMAALYLAFPFGFFPPREALTGLGRFEHAHHALDVLALFLPTAILLASEVLRGRVPAPDERGPSIRVRLRRAPRSVVVGSTVALVALLVLLGANGSTTVLVLVGVIGGLGLFGWSRSRAAVRRVRHDIE